MQVVHGLGAPSVQVQSYVLSSAVPIISPDITEGAISGIQQCPVTLHSNVTHSVINISSSLPVIY